MLLRTRGAPAREQIEPELGRAQDLTEKTGLAIRQPPLHQTRAGLAHLLGDENGQLREAHRLYTETGATGHAERLARELGP